MIAKLQRLVKQVESVVQKINNVSQLSQSQKQKIVIKINNPLQQLLVDCQQRQSKLNSLLNSQENNSPKPI